MRQALTPLAAVLALVASTAAAAPTPAAPSPVVVELFTSQGCNSCPPADAYLGELTKRAGVLALAFHVDYWNYIGWNDPFAKPWATGRQRAYQETMHQRYVYTPQMVVNGAAEGVGSEPGKIDPLIAAAATKPAAGPSVALHWLKDGALAVDVGDGASPEGQPATLWLVGYDKPHVTAVLRGENGGRSLTDYNAVRSYRRLGAWAGWSMEVVVPAEEAKALSDGGVAVLLQDQGTGPILSAATIAQPGS